MGHAPTELGDRMQITEVVALSAALITGMVASLYVVVWQSLRQRWAALYAAAFFVFFVTYVFDARMQPIEGRPNPWSATLALLGAWLMVLAMNSFAEMPRRIGLLFSGLIGVLATATSAAAILGSISRSGIFAAGAVVTALTAVQAIVANQRQAERGLGLVVLATLMYPVAYLFAATDVLPLPVLRYVRIVPVVLIGMAVLTTGLLVAQRRSEKAERELRAANESLERRVAQRTAELRDAVDQLDASNAELKALHASRTRLMAAACHDLRQPTHALGLLAEVASKQVSGAARQSVEGIRRCSLALCNMLDMLMDMTQLEAERYQPVLTPIALDDLLGEVRTEFSLVAERKGLTLHVQRNEAVVMSDHHLMRRILINLVSNAIKYTQTGGVEVSVQRRGEHAIIEVRDSGPGIPADKLDAAFTDFVRLDEARRSEGLGIGLPIVKRAAALLGHELRMTSEVGVGTTVTLVAPLTQAPVAAMLDPEPAIHNQGKLVGVVENDDMVLSAVSQLLHGYGFSVAAAHDAIELRHVLANTGRAAPDLLISDLNLGSDADGIELIDALRQDEHWRQTAFVLITGNLDLSVATQTAARGVTLAYKPVQPRKLLALLDGLLGHRPEVPGRFTARPQGA